MEQIIDEIQQHAKDVVNTKIKEASEWAQRKSNNPYKLKKNTTGYMALLCHVHELISTPFTLKSSIGEIIGILATRNGDASLNQLIDDFDFDDDEINNLLVNLKMRNLKRLIDIVFLLNKKYNILLKVAEEGNIEMAEWILSKGVDVDFPNSEGMTPLHAAADADQTDMVKFLLERGASAFALDKNGEVPFDKAMSVKQSAKYGFQTANLLAPHIFAKRFKPEIGLTCFHLAVYNGDYERTKYLMRFCYVDMKSNRGSTALHIACERNFPKIVELLITNFADVNEINVNLKTPLQIAIEGGFTRIINILIGVCH